MSQSNSGASASDDARVRDTYRDLATEQAPADLNDLVLRRATEAIAQRNTGLSHWLRPLALAASFFFCVAIVLDIRDQPPAKPNDLTGFRVSEAPIIDDAAAIARLQHNPGQADSPESGCAAREQATPENWYACVLRLENSGSEQAARQQETELMLAFPDFERQPAGR
jgi:hypothetical protein